MSDKNLDDDYISESLEQNLSDFFGDQNRQRQEIMTAFAYLDGYRVEDEIETRAKRNRKRKKPNINMASAIIKAVAGSEAMQERKLEVVAIDGNPQYDKDADIMGDCVEYAQHVSRWKSERALASRDAACTGIGATATYLDMTRRDVASGVPVCRRIFPGFLFYDSSGRSSDLNTSANWCGYGDPMRTKDLQRYIEARKGKAASINQGGGSAYTHYFLSDVRTNNADIDLLYHYFWREMVTVYDVTNPIIPDDGGQPSALGMAMQDDLAAEWMAQWAETVMVDLDAPYWTLGADEYKALEKVLADIAKWSGEDIALESSTRKAQCYYRAEYAQGMVISKSKSYSQEAYPLNFLTGYFDERAGIYYGLMRHLSNVQDSLNHVVDDLLEYSRTAATGGKAWVKGGKDDIDLINKSAANEDDITPVPANAEVIPKQLPGTGQILIQTATLLLDLLPRSVGLGQEFLGIISSGTMTDSLYGSVIKRSFAVLEDLTNSAEGYAYRQGVLFRDLMIGIARAEDGRLLPILSPGHRKGDYLRLYKQNLASNYIIRVHDRPLTIDDKQQMVRILTQLAPHLGAQSMQVLVEYLPIDATQKQKLMEAMTPQPQQPNPIDIATAEANARLLNAQAQELENKAAAIMARLDSEDDKIQSEVEKNVAAAVKSYADAGKTAADSVYQWSAGR